MFVRRVHAIRRREGAEKWLIPREKGVGRGEGGEGREASLRIHVGVRSCDSASMNIFMSAEHGAWSSLRPLRHSPSVPPFLPSIAITSSSMGPSQPAVVTALVIESDSSFDRR